MGMMWVDWKNKYNTQLTPEESRMYAQWLVETSMLTGRNMSLEEYDYDLRGFWKENGGFAENGHATDKFKKPNHPTFSKESQYHGKDGYEGGEWSKNNDGTWSFTAGKSNLEIFGEDRLKRYFAEREKGNTLIIRKKKTLEDLMSP